MLDGYEKKQKMCLMDMETKDMLEDTVGPFGCQGTLLTHIQPAVNQNPQIPFHGTSLHPLIPQSVHLSRVAPSQVQYPTLTKLHEISSYPLAGICKDLPAKPLHPQGSQWLCLI